MKKLLILITVILSFSIVYCEEDLTSNPLVNNEVAKALRSKNFVKVKDLIKKGANPNSIITSKDGNNETDLLFYSVETLKNEDMAKFLIENGADINSDVNGKNAVYAYETILEATCEYMPKVAQLLISKGAKEISDSQNVNNQESQVMTRAVVGGNKELIQLLIDKKFPVAYYGAYSRQSENTIETAVENKKYEIVQMLIKYGADINIGHNLNIFGAPINMAIMNNDIKMIKILVEEGKADLNKQEMISEDGYKYEYQSPLTQAIAEKNKQIFDYLISKGADVNLVYKNKDNENCALSFAIEEDNLEMVQYLIKNKAKKDIELVIDGESKKLIDLAIEKGNKKVISLIK